MITAPAAVARVMSVTIDEDERLALAPTAQPKAFETSQEALKPYPTATGARFFNSAAPTAPAAPMAATSA